MSASNSTPPVSHDHLPIADVSVTFVGTAGASGWRQQSPKWTTGQWFAVISSILIVSACITLLGAYHGTAIVNGLSENGGKILHWFSNDFANFWAHSLPDVAEHVWSHISTADFGYGALIGGIGGLGLMAALGIGTRSKKHAFITVLALAALGLGVAYGTSWFGDLAQFVKDHNADNLYYGLIPGTLGGMLLGYAMYRMGSWIKEKMQDPEKERNRIYEQELSNKDIRPILSPVRPHVRTPPMQELTASDESDGAIEWGQLVESEAERAHRIFASTAQANFEIGTHSQRMEDYEDPADTSSVDSNRSYCEVSDLPAELASFFSEQSNEPASPSSSSSNTDNPAKSAVSNEGSPPLPPPPTKPTLDPTIVAALLNATQEEIAAAQSQQTEMSKAKAPQRTMWEIQSRTMLKTIIISNKTGQWLSSDEVRKYPDPQRLPPVVRTKPLVTQPPKTTSSPGSSSSSSLSSTPSAETPKIGTVDMNESARNPDHNITMRRNDPRTPQPAISASSPIAQVTDNLQPTLKSAGIIVSVPKKPGNGKPNLALMSSKQRRRYFSAQNKKK